MTNTQDHWQEEKKKPHDEEHRSVGTCCTCIHRSLLEHEREEGYHEGWKEGVEREREEVIKSVEKMLPREIRTDIHDDPTPAEAWIRGKSFGSFMAIKNVLTLLQQRNEK